MLKGLHLTLLMGPTIPAPVPLPLTEALTAAQVTVAAGQRSGFQLTFNFGKRSLINQALLPAGFFDPGIRVILLLTVNGLPNVLMDGIIMRQEVQASDEPGQSTLSVTGQDLTLLMDLVENKGVPFPNMNALAKVGLIIAKYALYGMIPLVIPELFPSIRTVIQGIDFQEGTDMAYVDKLAKENGYVFYLDPGPAPGMSRAYWGPEIRIGVPQPALNINMDAHTNVESLSFSMDGSSREQTAIFLPIPGTGFGIPIPIPEVSLLKPPLALKQAPALKLKYLDDVAKQDMPRAIARAMSRASDSSDAITASGSLDVLRYGRVLSPRGLVGVRGAGIAYDGLYYVKSVTHNIKPGEYKQSFQLVRNGTHIHYTGGDSMIANQSGRYYGKYRGVVMNNVDPMQLGRLQVQVPDVLNLAPSGWALPAMPFAGTPDQGVFVLPADRRAASGWSSSRAMRPTRSGPGAGGRRPPRCRRWRSPRRPSCRTSSCRPPAQNSLVISDVPGPTGGIMLKASTGAMILINDTGITISNGQGATIMLTGPTVNINNGALTVI